MEPFPTVEAPYPFIGVITFALLPSPFLARMIPTVRNPTRQETATTAAMTMPAMAPEDRPEDDLEALGLLDGLDTGKDDVEALGLVGELDASEDKDVVASALDQQMRSRL